MANVRVKLTHVCNDRRYPGKPGDEVEVPEDVASGWFAKGGAVPVEPAQKPRATVAPVKAAPAAPVKEDPADETDQAQEEPKPKRGRRPGAAASGATDKKKK
jgi:hypothetical protein